MGLFKPRSRFGGIYLQKRLIINTAKLAKIKTGFLILSWGLYDLANQFFALNVVSLYFVRWVTIEKHTPEIFYSISFGISTFLVAVAGLILGAISDIVGRRQPFLLWLTITSVLFTISLGWINNIILALLLFIVANFGCQTATVFYNAMMANIAPAGKAGMVSGIGKVLSYSGAVLAVYFVKPVVLKYGYQAAFLPTGVLFLVFALPCLIFIKDKSPQDRINLFSFFKKDQITAIFGSLRRTILERQAFPNLVYFLKAIFFGFSAVNIIMLFMSVYATRAFGLNESQVIDLIVFATLFAMVGSFVSGYLSDRIGSKNALIATYILWIICFTFGALAKTLPSYWIAGALTGIALGSMWVVSRAAVLQIVPPEKMGEVFGLLNLVGYSSAIIGTFFWGVMLLFFSRLGAIGYRISLFSLNIFLLCGLFFLFRIKNEKRPSANTLDIQPGS